MLRRSLWPPLLLALTLLLVACDDSPGGESPTAVPTGLTRSFAMGLSSLPADLTEESYAQAFALASESGEVVLIRHTPPWGELLTDSFPSDSTVQTTQQEIDLSDANQLDIFFAIDATDRSEVTGQLPGLPEELLGASYADDSVREALVRYAQYVAINYKPAYLALGVEVNRLEKQDSEDFDHFVTLYHEAYAAIKDLSPDTLIFPTFQLEELAGLLPVDDPAEPQWELIAPFAPRADLLAVSSYPGVAFSDPDQIPSDYYAQLGSYSDRPIAIADMGYSSEPLADSPNDGTEAAQEAFLRRALIDADALSMPLIVWFVGQDPSFTGEPPFDLVQHIGLLRQDGTQKPAWSLWSEALGRPLPDEEAPAP